MEDWNHWWSCKNRRAKLKQWHIQHAKRLTDLHANSHIWIMWCQNEQRSYRCKHHRARETKAQSNISDKQTRCWYKLGKETNQRVYQPVYQKLVYRNEAFKTVLTGSLDLSFFPTRPRLSSACFFNCPHWQRAGNWLNLNNLYALILYMGEIRW